MTLRAIVFDFDGTLITGTNEGYFRCYHQAAVTQGYSLPYDVTKERVLEQWGKAPRIELASVLRESPERVEPALSVYNELLDTEIFSKDVAVVPGAKVALENLRELGLSTYVISGMPAKFLKLFSDRYALGFTDRELISTIETDEPQKQKTTGYHLGMIMSDMALSSNQIIVIGDSMSDYQMAESQKVRFVGVSTGCLTEQDKEITEFTMPSVAALPAFLYEHGWV